MSPSGAPVTTYCMRAEAPARSGWPSAIFLVSSSHSWLSHFDMSSSLGRRRQMRVRRRGAGLSHRRGMLPSGEVPHTGEEVVLGDVVPRRAHQTASQDVLVDGMDGPGHLGGK